MVEETNTFVEFTHSNVKHDAGQTTIPLIDSQPVIMKSAFPLNGIGLYYKGQTGYGGFIGARIFTDDLSQWLSSNNTL